MKQTVSILTGLIVVVLLATGLIVADNIDLSRRLEQQADDLLAWNARLDDSQKLLKKTTAERDALSRQLNEAVLASQTAHEAAEEQSRLNDAARLELEELKTEYLDLSKVCDALEVQMSALPQPQLHEDAPQPTPAPAVPIRRPERYVKN